MTGGTSLFRTACRKRIAVGLLAAAVAGSVAACGDSATGPSGGSNSPPTIQSLVAGAPQVEVAGDQTVQLTATVTDAETSPGQLTYNWSASPENGTFTGTGAQVRWKPPTTTPAESTITLTVVETYSSGSAMKENRVSSTLPVRYNDLIIGGLVSQFLTDFGTFEVGPAQCVRNFSDNASCGKASELRDVQNNRSDFHIFSASYQISSLTYTNSTFARVLAPCTFKDRRNSDGVMETVSGTCNLTAVYESPRWALCTSGFDPPFTTTIGSVGTPTVTLDRALLPRYSHP